MKRIALCVLAGAMLLAVNNVSQAGDGNSCCQPKSCLPKLSFPKMSGLKSLFSIGGHKKCEPCCAAPAVTPAPQESPAPTPPAELSPSAADTPKKK